MTSSKENREAVRWKNGVGKRCDCPNRPRCDCWWWIRVQHTRNGEKERVFKPVHKFAFLLGPNDRMPDTRADAEALAAKVLDWLVHGKPMVEPVAPAAAVAERTGNDLIDGWLIWRKTKQRLKKQEVQDADASKVKRAREEFGALTVTQLADPQVFHAFVNRELDKNHEIATPNRIMAAVMRPAIRWGLSQEPPWLPKSPFGEHRFQIDTNAENKRTERCPPDREARILAAVAKMGTQKAEKPDGRVYARWHRSLTASIEALADFIVMAIDLGARSGELHRLTNADVDWHGHLITLRKTKRRGETRLVPFNPFGRVAEILTRRRFAGATAKVIDSKKLTKLWIHAICIAYDLPYSFKKRGGYFSDETIEAYQAVNLTMHDLRHEAATWWGLCGVSDEDRDFLEGHQSQSMGGRYSHEKLARAKAALAAKVWPRERERAVA